MFSVVADVDFAQCQRTPILGHVEFVEQGAVGLEQHPPAGKLLNTLDKIHRRGHWLPQIFGAWDLIDPTYQGGIGREREEVEKKRVGIESVAKKPPFWSSNGQVARLI